MKDKIMKRLDALEERYGTLRDGYCDPLSLALREMRYNECQKRWSQGDFGRFDETGNWIKEDTLEGVFGNG